MKDEMRDDEIQRERDIGKTQEIVHSINKSNILGNQDYNDKIVIHFYV